ncbi:hypothetical protein [Labrys wisconsinensis]|uniref:Uncharacterized protein n=1 Tax=Labrys wisconsinensis TaxID=425677 RepID=A0ABU0J144_9HYPH|nr:hypothetical protein [Labrys wisconsinensis]MDQ0467024.1 hypothetical protein [Labrys wisconsinensis]
MMGVDVFVGRDLSVMDGLVPSIHANTGHGGRAATLAVALAWRLGVRVDGRIKSAHDG